MGGQLLMSGPRGVPAPPGPLRGVEATLRPGSGGGNRRSAMSDLAVGRESAMDAAQVPVQVRVSRLGTSPADQSGGRAQEHLRAGDRVAPIAAEYARIVCRHRVLLDHKLGLDVATER